MILSSPVDFCKDRRRYDPLVILHAFIEPIPEDNSGAVVQRAREATAEGADYAEAVAAVREQVGEGERIIAFRIER